MSDENEFAVPEIAAFIIGVAKEKGYINDSLAVAPELVEKEKEFLSWVTSQIRDYVNAKNVEQLDEHDIMQLFNFLFAKGCEFAYHWRVHEALIEMDKDAVFEDRIVCNIDNEMLDRFNDLPFAVDFAEAFQDWNQQHATYCSDHGIHPILPLVEAMKWIYRISLSLAFDYLDE